MKRILTLILLFAFSPLMAGVVDEMSESYLGDVAQKICDSMKGHMAFYTGTGNVYQANTSGFPGIKLGMGIGISAPFSGFDNISKLFGALSSPDFTTVTNALSLAPMPYDMVFAKIGIPALPMDVGLRLGYIPAMNFGSYGFKGEFHFGVEARYILFELPAGIIKVDGRLSYDVDNGGLKMNSSGTESGGTYDIGFDYNWAGSSLGAKIVGGVNIPLIGGVYAGVGANLNFGKVTTKIDAKINSSPVASAEKSANYDLFDLKLIAGGYFAFVSLAAEFGLLSGDMSITFFPFFLTF